MRRHALWATVAGLALITQSACTATAGPSAEPSASSPAAASPAGPPSAPATTGPRTPVTASPHAQPVATRTAPQRVDWKRITFAALGCPRTAGIEKLPAEAEVTSVRRADLTGDGRPESIVAAACRSTTAPNPIRVFVHEGAARRTPGKLLLTVGTNQYLTSAEVTVKGGTVRVVSRALSDRAPRCCPDLRITQSYTWTGTAFRPSGMKQAGL